MGKRQTDSESGGERVNLKTLASLLELSQTTISLVLNDSPCGAVDSRPDPRAGL